jgi:hypothetical protein
MDFANESLWYRRTTGPVDGAGWRAEEDATMHNPFSKSAITAPESEDQTLPKRNSAIPASSGGQKARAKRAESSTFGVGAASLLGDLPMNDRCVRKSS